MRYICPTSAPHADTLALVDKISREHIYRAVGGILGAPFAQREQHRVPGCIQSRRKVVIQIIWISKVSIECRIDNKTRTQCGDKSLTSQSPLSKRPKFEHPSKTLVFE